ncbi:MAG TPA: hypothetical protein VN495_04535 [Candidatus Paceibacterota bacterium]|nr:hypothetical protein [Candidatus Paceibacterota bacterium]
MLKLFALAVGGLMLLAGPARAELTAAELEGYRATIVQHIRNEQALAGSKIDPFMPSKVRDAQVRVDASSNILIVTQDVKIGGKLAFVVMTMPLTGHITGKNLTVIGREKLLRKGDGAEYYEFARKKLAGQRGEMLYLTLLNFGLEAQRLEKTPI